MAKNKARPTTDTTTKKTTKKQETKKTASETTLVATTNLNEEDIKILMSTPILVFYSNSAEMKKYAVKKYLPIKQIINNYIVNPNCFIGIVLNKDLKIIKNLISVPDLKIDYRSMPTDFYPRFYTWLQDNTKFSTARLK